MTEEQVRAIAREEAERVAIAIVCKAIREVVNPTYQTPAFKQHIADIAISACKNVALRNG